MLRSKNQIRVTGKGSQMAARVGNSISDTRGRGVVAGLTRQAETSASKETANYFNGNMGGNNSMVASVLPQGGMVYDTMLSGLMGDNEQANMRFYRDIYHHDTVGGPCVDLMSTMPFSDFHLVGCEDPKRLDKYNSAIESLNLKTMFPEISVDYLVTGTFISTLIYKANVKKFVDMITWRNEDCQITPTPFQGMDPVLKVKPNTEIREFLSSTDPQFQKMRSSMNGQMLDALRSDTVDLDPLTTIFLPRKTFTYANKGTSFFKRLLPLYLIEKSLYRGTLIEAGRRQRSLLHVPMGDDMWDPSPEEMQAVVSLFQQADLDPLGAIVGTRGAVLPAELRQGGDFWKYTDVTEITTSMKLRALGISESFLSGEATYSSMEVSLSVFVENLRAYRDMVTRKIFHGKIFPLVAYTNSFMKKGMEQKHREEKAAFGQVHLQHNLNDATMLDMPNVHWTKALRPEADQQYLAVLSTLKENDVPVSIATWAAAGGMTVEALMKDLKEDKKIREDIKKIMGPDAFEKGDENSGSEEAAIISVLSRALGRGGRKALLSRDFSHEAATVTKTGKKKAVVNQRTFKDAQYAMLAKAAKNMSDPHYANNVLKSVHARLGRTPPIF